MSKRKPKPATHPAITAIRYETARAGWPVYFKTDLTHDERAIVGMMPREPFAWCLRADGTHIARAPEPKSGSSARIKPLTMVMCADTFGAESCRFYVWDGIELAALATAELADERLAKLASERYEVNTRRASSFVSAYFATQGEADACAIEWERRYGEDMRVTDTWSAS